MLSYFYAKCDLRNRDNVNPIQILLKSCYHMHMNVVIMGGSGNGNLKKKPGPCHIQSATR